jgi:hypothetical protein
VSKGSSPPLISPDGEWIWDGEQWQPVAKPQEVSHQAVFAAWKGIAAEKAQPDQVAQAARPTQAQVPASPPVIDNPFQVPAAPGIPLWQQTPKSGMTKYLYIAAGLIAVVVAAYFLSSLSSITWPWTPAPPPGPIPTTPTPPLKARSDSARASLFYSGVLVPSLGGLDQSLPILKETCTGSLTFSCQNAINDGDKDIKHVLFVIDHQTIPACIAKHVTRLRLDLTGMDSALQTALLGYQDNRASELSQGLSGFSTASQTLQADINAIGTAQKNLCSAQVVGP